MDAQSCGQRPCGLQNVHLLQFGTFAGNARGSKFPGPYVQTDLPRMISEAQHLFQFIISFSKAGVNRLAASVDGLALASSPNHKGPV